jgi:DNA-binding FadR family transcriptional regulator
MVARMRRGSGGGLRVIEPDESAVTSAAALYLDYRGVRVRHLYAARTVLESRCVELAVQQLTEDGIARLRAVVKELKADDPLLLVEMVHDVEGMIADLSGDPVLSLFVHVLLQLAHQHVMAPAERHPGRKRYLLAVRDHLVGVAEAVIAGDAPTARVRLCRYLELAESGARQHYLAAAGTHEGVVAAGL